MMPQVAIDLAHPPSRIEPIRDRPAVSLDWDRTIDDEGRLRRCPVCGCNALFTRKLFPQLTGLAAILLAAYLVLLILGHPLQWAAMAVFVVVTAADVYFYIAGPVKLVCYRRGSEFSGVTRAEHHRRWDAALAEQHRD